MERSTLLKCMLSPCLSPAQQAPDNKVLCSHTASLLERHPPNIWNQPKSHQTSSRLAHALLLFPVGGRASGQRATGVQGTCQEVRRLPLRRRHGPLCTVHSVCVTGPVSRRFQLPLWCQSQCAWAPHHHCAVLLAGHHHGVAGICLILGMQ